jgi:hypothetical protein
MTKSTSVSSPATAEAVASKPKREHFRYIYDNDDIGRVGFGLVSLKQEGAPQHPDEYDWEHPPGSGCEQCRGKYDRALARYLAFVNK